jgi:gas vesicle protein
MKKLMMVSAVTLALSGCSSIKWSSGFEYVAPGGSGTDTKAAQAPAAKTPQAPQSGDEVKYPAWYTEKQSGDAIYAVASEYSKDFQLAVDKATMSAKRELASNFSSHISAMMKDFTTEMGADSAVVRELDRTTKLVVNKVNLIGVQRTNFKVQHEDGGYRAYVQLKYSQDESNKLLMAELKRNRQLEAQIRGSRAFKELEREIAQPQAQPAPVVAQPVDTRPVE